MKYVILNWNREIIGNIHVVVDDCGEPVSFDCEFEADEWARTELSGEFQVIEIEG